MATVAGDGAWELRLEEERNEQGGGVDSRCAGGDEAGESWSLEHERNYLGQAWPGECEDGGTMASTIVTAFAAHIFGDSLPASAGLNGECDFVYDLFSSRRYQPLWHVFVPILRDSRP